MGPISTSAFESIVAEHGATVQRVCTSILRDEHLGADAAQETFLRLWNRIHEGRAPTRFGGWLKRVAVTTALDLRRARPRTSEDEGEPVLQIYDVKDLVGATPRNRTERRTPEFQSQTLSKRERSPTSPQESRTTREDHPRRYESRARSDRTPARNGLSKSSDASLACVHPPWHRSSDG